MQGLLHPDGVYDDPHGGILRSGLYRRLRVHFQFRNELPLFQEVNHNVNPFSVNVYAAERASVGFRHISSLFHPSTVDTSIEHDGAGVCGGIKDDSGSWNTNGHQSRVIEIDEPTLGLFAQLYDHQASQSLEARLPVLHSRELLHVLRRFSEHPRRLSDLKGRYTSSEMWNETQAVVDGTIIREPRFPMHSREWILSGPHIAPGNPISKTPRRVCTDKSHYDTVDLTLIPADYHSRTNYLPACDPVTYLGRMPLVSWDPQVPVSSFYRLAYRGMLSQPRERTLIAAIIPPNSGHIHGTQSTAFADSRNLLSAAFVAASLIADLFIKTTGRNNLHYSWEPFPHLDLDPRMAVLVLMLNCLNEHYSDLWRDCWQDDFVSARWSKRDPRLDNVHFASLTPDWCWATPLRTDYERRQSLLEIDVLAVHHRRGKVSMVAPRTND